ALHDAADGDGRAEKAAALLDQRATLQPALGMVHSALLTVAAVAAAWALTRLLSGWLLAAGLATLAVVLVSFGDVLPREWGRGRPRVLAYRFIGLLVAAVSLGERAADVIADDDEPGASLAPDAAETAESQKRELISSVIEFTDAIVREVMVPRPDMLSVPATADTSEALDLAVAEGRSRIPVVGDGPDEVVGLFYARDLLRLMVEDGDHVAVKQLMRPAYFVPETKQVSELLREMQGNQVHMAIVVDEFGSTAGLVTIEDLIEELVGEIADEYDVEEPMVVAMGTDSYRIDGRLAVDELGDLFDLELPDEDWDTVGGLVLGLAGRVPEEGESFDLDGLIIVAERVQGRRVAEVTVKRG
ncbi:MAG: hemolysin family protein, partial [Acidimicrobiia bacterium]|nr:hemolysin family protein [Acidimicrobiia bacterium]